MEIKLDIYQFVEEKRELWKKKLKFVEKNKNLYIMDIFVLERKLRGENAVNLNQGI